MVYEVSAEDLATPAIGLRVLLPEQRVGCSLIELAWVRAGRFSDGRHREVAFMLWTTPSIGATAYMYRVASGRFGLLAKVGGDTVKLGRGTVTVGFENRGRSPDGELTDVLSVR